MAYLTMTSSQTCRILTWSHMYQVPPSRYITDYVITSFGQQAFHRHLNVTVPMHNLTLSYLSHLTDLTASERYVIFRHLFFKLGRAGHGPWAGHASVWSWSWSWSCNWRRQVCSRCRSPKPAKVSMLSTAVRPSRSVPSLRICTQGSSNFGPGPSRPFAFVPKAVLILVIKEEKSF